jgi:hypothetical protein
MPLYCVAPGAGCIKLVTTRFVVKWQLTLKYAFLIGQFSHLTIVNLNYVFIQLAPGCKSKQTSGKITTRKVLVLHIGKHSLYCGIHKCVVFM